MNVPKKQTGPVYGRSWVTWVFWIFAAVTLLLLVPEHRAHALGWGLHALLGLCVVLLYLVIRADGGGDRDGSH